MLKIKSEVKSKRGGEFIMTEIFIVIPEKERLERLFSKMGDKYKYAKENFFPRILEHAGESTTPDALASILRSELEAYVEEHNLPISMEEDIYSFAKNELINILVDNGGIRKTVRKRISNLLKV
jgi:hypothetical protein